MCGLDDGGLIHCWGAGQSDLGVSPDFGQSIVPAGVFTKAVVSGDYHSCGQDEDGYVTCWGNSKNGRLNVPEVLFSDFDIGGEHGCGFDIYGDLICWGSDVFDQSTVDFDGDGFDRMVDCDDQKSRFAKIGCG